MGSCIDGFSRMAVPFHDCLRLSPCSDEEEQTTWQFYRQRLPSYHTTIFYIHDTIQHLTNVVGTDKRRDIINGSITNFLNFPTLAGHLWFMYPLISLYLFIPIIISPWLRKASAKEERFFIGLFLLSTCIPYLNRWCGEVWGQCFWNEYHMLWYFSGYLGYLVLAHYIHTHLTWSRSKRFIIGTILMVIGAVLTISLIL